MNSEDAKRLRDMERAQAALTKFRSLTPMLTGFLRGITGQKRINLVAGATTHTTKDKVVIAPPIALGTEYRHESRRYCGKRDDEGLPLCAGCQAWEEVFVSLVHEMSHVAFTRIESKEWRAAYTKALPRAAKILGVEAETSKLEMKAENAKKVDPYIPIIANALEDIRVDSAMVAERPGIAAMQRASWVHIMSGTLEVANTDGTVRVIDWAQADPTAQVTVSLISAGMGYGVHPAMAEEVADFIARDDIARICAEVAVSDLETVLIRTAEVISAGRAEGFFPLEDIDPSAEAMNAEGEEGDGQGEGQGVAKAIPADLAAELEAVGEQGHDSSGAEARARADASPSTPGGVGGAEGEHGDLKEAMELVLKQEGWTDAPTVEFAGVEYSSWEAERRSSSQDCGTKPSEAVLGPTLGKLRAMLAPNQLHTNTRHLRVGKIDSRVLGRRAPVEDDRLFMRKQDETKRDFFFVLGLDVSGSTAAASGEGDRRVVDVLVSAAWAQAELLHRLGVPFTIITHTTSYGRGSGLMVDLSEVKGPDEPWNPESQARLRTLEPRYGNLDARAMVAFRKIAERHPAREKFVIQYSDGEFPVTNVEDEEAVIASEIEVYRKLRDFHFMMVGIQTDSPSRFGFDFVRVDNEGQTMRVVDQIGKAVR